MQVQGKRTFTENVTVDVNPSAVLQKVYEKSIPHPYSYLSLDGFWYKESGFDYHKREELYDKGRPATEEEITLDAAFRLVMDFTKRTCE